MLIITVAAPVYNRSDPTVLLGVFGIDMDISSIEKSILGLTIIGNDSSKDENGYAYLLSPGREGEVVIHKDIDIFEDDQFITDIEEGINEDEFDGIVSKISSECKGSANYSRYEERWLLAWGHETESFPGAVGNENCEGFAVVVTVKESILLKVRTSHAVSLLGHMDRYRIKKGAYGSAFDLCVCLIGDVQRFSFE